MNLERESLRKRFLDFDFFLNSFLWCVFKLDFEVFQFVFYFIGEVEFFFFFELGVNIDEEFYQGFFFFLVFCFLKQFLKMLKILFIILKNFQVFLRMFFLGFLICVRQWLIVLLILKIVLSVLVVLKLLFIVLQNFFLLFFMVLQVLNFFLFYLKDIFVFFIVMWMFLRVLQSFLRLFLVCLRFFLVQLSGDLQCFCRMKSFIIFGLQCFSVFLIVMKLLRFLFIFLLFIMRKFVCIQQ